MGKVIGHDYDKYVYTPDGAFKEACAIAKRMGERAFIYSVDGIIRVSTTKPTGVIFLCSVSPEDVERLERKGIS